MASQYPLTLMEETEDNLRGKSMNRSTAPEIIFLTDLFEN